MFLLKMSYWNSLPLPIYPLPIYPHPIWHHCAGLVVRRHLVSYSSLRSPPVSLLFVYLYWTGCNMSEDDVATLAFHSTQPLYVWLSTRHRERGSRGLTPPPHPTHPAVQHLDSHRIPIYFKLCKARWISEEATKHNPILFSCLTPAAFQVKRWVKPSSSNAAFDSSLITSTLINQK